MFKGIIHTLDSIEVHGKDNLDKLLGCILLLESFQQRFENDLKAKAGPEREETKPEKEEKADG